MSLREQKTAKKREEILHSALTIMAQKGYHGTTMEDIASHLFITKGALYYYFKDKQELVYESQIKILQQSIENFKTIYHTDDTPTEKLKAVVKVHITFLIRNQSGFELMMKPENIFSEAQFKEIIHLRDQYAVYYDALLAEGLENGAFKIDNIKIVRNILLGAMNWVAEWYSMDGGMDEATFSDTVTQYVMRMVVN